jgi:hypothetical protein
LKKKRPMKARWRKGAALAEKKENPLSLKGEGAGGKVTKSD